MIGFCLSAGNDWRQLAAYQDIVYAELCLFRVASASLPSALLAVERAMASVRSMVKKSNHGVMD
jgi:hypothetical protein